MKAIKHTPWIVRDEKIYDSRGRFVTKTAPDLAVEIALAVNQHAKLIELSDKLLDEVRAHRGDEQSEKLVSEAYIYLQALKTPFV